MTTAVYGGSFDPFGINHLLCVTWLVDEGGFDRVLVVPSAAHSEKKDQTPYHHRISMARKGVSHLTNVTVSNVEAEILLEGHTGPIYAYTLLSYLQKRGVGDMRFAIGGDLVNRTKNWYLGDRVREEFGFCVIPDGITTLRATAVRECIRNGGEWDHRVSPEVAAYIREHKLYQKETV